MSTYGWRFETYLAEETPSYGVPFETQVLFGLIEEVTGGSRAAENIDAVKRFTTQFGSKELDTARAFIKKRDVAKATAIIDARVLLAAQRGVAID